MNSLQGLKEQNSFFNHFMLSKLCQSVKSGKKNKGQMRKTKTVTSTKKYLIIKCNYLPQLQETNQGLRWEY